MSEIQRVVDELRFMLQREVIDQTDELAALVRDYSAHCHDTNVRLRKCDERLKQGLRAEALQLAEAAPHLLDLVAILDFAERPQLLEVVATYFFAPPEPLLLDIASALNEAYALQEPLVNLLDTHRLLVLGRCSLARRLPVLRSLAKLDPATPHWEADVRDMERSRLSEMETEVKTAATSGDMVALKSLLAETQAEGWCEPIPAALLRTIKSRVTQTQRSHSRGRMEELSAELHTALQARDIDRARSLRDEWNRELKAVPLPAGDPLKEQVAPILNWLDDEDRSMKNEQAYEQAVADLERAVMNDTLSLADLKRIGLEFDRHQRALPETLEARYRRRLVDQAKKEKLRRQMLIAASIAGFIAVSGAFGGIIYLSNEGQKERRLVAAIDALIRDGHLAEARQRVDQRPGTSTSETWLALTKKLIDAERADQGRSVQFQAAIETAEQSTETARIEPAIKRADALALTADEEARVEKVRSMWQDRVARETTDREKQFRDLLASAKQPLQSVETSLRGTDSVDLDQLAQLLRDAGVHVSKFQSTKGLVAKELQDQATVLEKRHEAARQGVTDLNRKHDLLDRLTNAALLLPVVGQVIPKAGAFEATLREFTSAFPSDTRSIVMKDAAEASPLPAVLARQRLIDRWRSLRPTSDKDVETRLREIRTFLAEHSSSPDRDSIIRYQTWLNAVLLRFAEEGDPDEGLRQKLIKLFSGKFVKEGHILRDNEGRTFYIPEAHTEEFGSTASFQYFFDYNGKTKPTKGLKPTDFQKYKSELPPQKEIAANVRMTLKDIGINNWQTSLREITDIWIKATPVDACLRHKLVTTTLVYAGNGDPLLEQELAPVLKALNDDDDFDSTVAWAEWMDPYNKKAEDSRKRASLLLAKVPALEPIFDRAIKRQEDLEREVFAIKFSVGWLEKSPRGKWECRTKWSPTGNHTLHVVTRPDASGFRKWLELGRVQGGKFDKTDSAIAESVGEAAVVFASSSDPKTAK